MRASSLHVTFGHDWLLGKTFGRHGLGWMFGNWLFGWTLGIWCLGWMLGNWLLGSQPCFRWNRANNNSNLGGSKCYQGSKDHKDA